MRGCQERKGYIVPSGCQKNLEDFCVKTDVSLELGLDFGLRQIDELIDSCVVWPR